MEVYTVQKAQLFSKIWKQNQYLRCYIALGITLEGNKNKNNKLEDFRYDITYFSCHLRKCSI